MTKDNKVNLSLFILRLVLGLIFMGHGAQKMFGMFGGIGIEGTAKMMEGLGFSYPEIIGRIWSMVELAGGFLIIVGVLTRYAALCITMLMLITIWKVSLVYGFFLQNGGYEYNLLIIASSMPLIFLGGGSWSVWDV